MRTRLCLALAALVFLLLTASASASQGALRILIVFADSPAPATIQAQIKALPGVAAVDTFDADTLTPSAAQLAPYDVVMAFSNNTWGNQVAIGNALADYVDAGGVVTEFDYALFPAGDNPTGRWVTGGYSPYTPGNTLEGANVSTTPSSSSPLLAGVGTLTNNNRTNPTLVPGATELAKWSDGLSAIAFKGRVVAVNGYVGDAPSMHTGAYANIVVNAGNVLGRRTLDVSRAGSGSGGVTSSPGGIACGTTCTAQFTNGTGVTLTATPSPGSTFGGWSGSGCSGIGTCTVTMSQARSVTATFNLIPPPHLSGAFATHSRFRASRHAHLIRVARRRPPIGTTFKFTLDKAAVVRLVFTQRRPGRRVNGRCVAPRRSNRHKHHCTRTVTRGSLTIVAHAGVNSVQFLGWLSPTRKLGPGRYRLAITATTIPGGSTSKSVPFRIVR